MKLNLRTNTLKLTVIVVFSFWSVFSIAQSEVKIDSLENIIENTDGKIKMSALDQLCEIYISEAPEKAILYALELLQLARNESNLKFQDLATSYLGEAYFYMDDIENSVGYFNKYLEINTLQNDTDGIATAHNNLGIIHRYTDNYDKAIDHYIKSLEIKEIREDTIGISNTLNNLGVLYFHIGNYKKALEYYEHSLSIENEQQNANGIATSLLNIGEVLSKMNQFNRSVSYLQNAIEIADSINDITTLELCYQTLSEIHKDNGNYQRAMYFHEKFDELKGIRINEETKAQIAELEIEYQSVQQQKEITLLNKQKELYSYIMWFLAGSFIVFSILLVLLQRQIRAKKSAAFLLAKQNETVKKQSEVLEQLNATKDKFFSIISHDLKGAIGGFLSQTQFMAEDYDMLTDQDKHELIDQMSLSSKRLYSLLENLLDWAKSQTGVLKYDPEHFNLQDLVDSIIAIYKTKLESKDINLKLQIGPQVRCYADINMISSVIRNLLMNAIKFSHPYGNIELKANQIENNVEVTIADEGVGIDDKTKNRLFSIEYNVSAPGTQEEIGTGLGLILIKEFVEKHGGRIWVDSQKGKGASFHFTIPAAS